MEESQQQNQTLEIGLVMAGAVSAGAYTAGMIDYLLEALDAWEEAKKEATANLNNDAKVPMHKVRIRVMSGASAGGMVCAITASELLHREKEKKTNGGKLPAAYQSLLYQAWVKKIDIDPLLKTGDIDNGKPVYSLLNTDSFEEIADTIILGGANNIPKYEPLPDYIDPELKMYLTLSNLRGLPYEFNLKGETGLPYGMTDNADYQYFELSQKTQKSQWHKLRNAAIATGAFPVGLKARLIERDTTEYATRLTKDGRDISGKLKLNTVKGVAYPFVAVDGGVLNNEPIELARSVLAPAVPTKATGKSITELKIEERDTLVAGKHALVIIDPFPNFSDTGKPATLKDTRLLSILVPIISALRSQNLFKPEEMMMASAQNNHTRFLVAPVRKNKGGSIAPQALACGFLGGFGGFLLEDFREHDYRLGRRNAQKFLMDYFVLPEHLIEALNGNTVPVSGKELPIIPIIKDSVAAIEQGEDNPWPCYSQEQLDALAPKVRKRIGRLTENIPLIGHFSKTWVKATIIGIALFIITGECVKFQCAAGDNWFSLFNGFYILILQLVFGFIMIVMLLLLVSKSIIDSKLTAKTIAYLKDIINEWGIALKSK
jgi:Patatin-like phospholipase